MMLELFLCVGWGLALLSVGAEVWSRVGREHPDRDCKTCMFNVEGGCRRYPPQRVYTGSKQDDPQALDVTVFPVIANASAWWCGEWRKRS